MYMTNVDVCFTVAPAVLSEIVDSTDDGRDVANFTCEATGEPIPDISWYFNGVMIDMSDTSKYRIESRSLNTTTTENTLTVYNVTSSNVGTYTCNSTNTIGTDNSHGEVICGIYITCYLPQKLQYFLQKW